MQALYDSLKKLIKDLFRIATSRQTLQQHLRQPLYANSIYILVHGSITALTGMIFWVVAARLYTAEEVGLGSATLSVISLLGMIALLGFNFSIIRFLSGSGEESNRLINTCMTISGLVAAAAAVIFLLGVNVWSPALSFISRNGIYFSTFVIFAVITTLLNILGHTYIAKRRAGYLVGQSVIFNILKVVLVGVLALFFGYFGMLGSWVLAAFFSITVSVFLFLPRIQKDYHPIPTISGKMTGQIFSFSILNYLSNLLWEAPTFLLPVIVVNLLGAEQNAYFYISWALGGLLREIPRSISLSLFAEGSNDEESISVNVRRSLKSNIVLLIPAIILVFAIGDKLLLLFGREYSEQGTKLLWLMAAAGIPISVNFIYISIKRVEKKLTGIVTLAGFVAAVTVALSYVLLPRMGLTGAGIAWLTAHGAAAIFIVGMYLKNRISKQPVV